MFLFQFTHPVRDVIVTHDPDAPIIVISIHTSRAGCDAPDFRSGRVYIKFQFTHPVRDVTARPSSVQADIPISIHTSRAGCDNVRTKIL